MKPEPAIVAERTAARHCAELLRAGPPPVALLPLLAGFGARLAHGLEAGLATLSGGDAVDVSCADPRDCGVADLREAIAPLAANCLLGVGVKQAPCLISIEAGAVLAMVDRTFGGRGSVPDPLPEVFPLSAEMMINRLEAAVLAALADALDGEGEGTVQSLRRDSSLFRLAPFADAEPLAMLTLTVAQGSHAPWRMTLVVPNTALAGWFANTAGSRSGSSRAAHGSLEAFETMPLSIEAVLVDMMMPFSAISALQPGQVLPVSVARNIPLSVGGRTVAHGQVGAMDDRVAIQITNAF